MQSEPSSASHQYLADSPVPQGVSGRKVVLQLRTLYDRIIIIPSVWIALFLVAASLVRYADRVDLLRLEGEELLLLTIGWNMAILPVILTLRFVIPKLLCTFFVGFFKMCARMSGNSGSVQDKSQGVVRLLGLGTVHGAAVAFLYYLPLSQESYIPSGFRHIAVGVACWGIATWFVISLFRLSFATVKRDFEPTRDCGFVSSKADPR